jgi:hypothetical protein
MKVNRVLIVVIAIVLYLIGPIIAGLLGLGERDGPIIYSSEYHTVLYIAAYESARNEKPRLSLDHGEFDRPLFYGLPRRRR